MNVTEHLLTCLAEEAAEIVKACAKANRFGLGDGYPCTKTTNAADIMHECTDLFAVLDMLHKRGDVSGSLDVKRIREKQAKVRKYMDYAIKRGTLTPDKK